MKAALLLWGLAAALPRAADAQDFSERSYADRWLTGYVGARFGGDFKDAVDDERVHLDDSTSVALSYDQTLDEERQLQLIFGYQDTRLELSDRAQPQRELPLGIYHLHVGGTSYFEGELGNGSYLVGGLGVTLFEPDGPGLDSELRPSADVGFGYQLPLGDNLALRFELRVRFVLLDSSAQLFCDGGCVAAVRGSGLTQGEATLGLSFGW
jgi:hypothetical protein